MSTEPVLPPPPSPAAPAPAVPAPAPHSGRRVASAVLSSVLLLFGLVFAPMGIAAAVAAEPLGSAWSTGSNMINVVFTWVFAVGLLALVGAGIGAIALARSGRSTGLAVYALVVTVLLLIGAVGLIAAGVIMVSG